LQQAAPGNYPAFGSSIGYIQIEPHKHKRRWVKASSGTVSGSRLLPSYRTAT
jgi:hypothetical protein